MKIVYDSRLMQYISLFESLTKVKVKDSYLKDKGIVFIVERGGLFKAIGKNGANIKKIENMLNKRIKVVEFDESVEKFVINLVKPVEVEVSLIDQNVEIKPKEARTKGLLIGREGKNLKELKDIISRHYKIDSVKII
tara:strand:+ start:998 stop:1408 length:411 start_codon:yes stop_codon:yes gene_type:complete